MEHEDNPASADLTRALAMLTTALCSAVDARVVLESLIENAAAIEAAGATTPGLYDMVHTMQLAASSASVKQNPGDQDMVELYRDLRAGQRH